MSEEGRLNMRRLVYSEQTEEKLRDPAELLTAEMREAAYIKATQFRNSEKPKPLVLLDLAADMHMLDPGYELLKDEDRERYKKMLETKAPKESLLMFQENADAYGHNLAALSSMGIPIGLTDDDREVLGKVLGHHKANLHRSDELESFIKLAASMWLCGISDWEEVSGVSLSDAVVKKAIQEQLAAHLQEGGASYSPPAYLNLAANLKIIDKDFRPSAEGAKQVARITENVTTPSIPSVQITDAIHYLARARILAARDIRMTEKGVELVMGGKLHKEQIPPLPEIPRV